VLVEALDRNRGESDEPENLQQLHDHHLVGGVPALRPAWP
jgi:hypothetical protein